MDKKSSGKRWAEVIHTILRGHETFYHQRLIHAFGSGKQPNLRCYEYIAIYVDDLCIAAESPQRNYSDFQVKVPFQGQKGEGKLTYHLGAVKTQMELLLANLRNTLIS